MLGHIVVAHLRERGLEVLTSDARYSAAPGDPLISAAVSSGADWIVNAAGRIKQKSAQPFDLFLGNSLLPAQLKSFLKPNQRLIHASTDCVFSGKAGNYPQSAPRDADDVYGLSKILGEVIGEPSRCQILRTSIIGPELGSASGLMGWFLKQSGPVNGFTNHFWNGITTLEWAKLCGEIITGALKPSTPILQVGSAESVSKYELLKLIADIWPHQIQINPVEAPERVDRTLQPALACCSLRHQIRELRQFAA